MKRLKIRLEKLVPKQSFANRIFSLKGMELILLSLIKHKILKKVFKNEKFHKLILNEYEKLNKENKKKT
jgi:hypothetical protein